MGELKIVALPIKNPWIPGARNIMSPGSNIAGDFMLFCTYPQTEQSQEFPEWCCGGGSPGLSWRAPRSNPKEQGIRLQPISICVSTDWCKRIQQLNRGLHTIEHAWPLGHLLYQAGIVERSCSFVHPFPHITCTRINQQLEIPMAAIEIKPYPESTETSYPQWSSDSTSPSLSFPLEHGDPCREGWRSVFPKLG